MSPGSGLSNSCSGGQSDVQGRGLFLVENNGRESVKVVGVYCWLYRSFGKNKHNDHLVWQTKSKKWGKGRGNKK